jgi:hypothetical protein
MAIGAATIMDATNVDLSMVFMFPPWGVWVAMSGPTAALFGFYTKFVEPTLDESLLNHTEALIARFCNRLQKKSFPVPCLIAGSMAGVFWDGQDAMTTWQ